MRHPLLILLLLSSLFALGQNPKDRRLVQFSGVVVTGDSLDPVPFTSILTRGSYRGTISDVYGYYSFVAQAGDTLEFAAVGFKRGNYVIPDTLSDSKYSMIHVLYPDTMLLRPVDVYPWPSREQFRDAFLALNLSDNEYQRVLKHLNSAEAIQRMENLPPDPGLAAHYQTALDNTRIYNQGMAPTINLFNPIAWAQFVQAWKAGSLKKQ
ncbi:MAG: carboxypeptidase-like regulatory domain-containing protein [Flavobacteriales bacterium]|nr:carboxypeptidase-like regulatory domain-containing protein [Flavobacteriales bacterium]